MLLNRSFLIIVLISLLLPGSSFAAPTIHFGPAPAWVIPAKNNDQQPNLRDIDDGYYLKLYEQEVNVAKDEEYHHTIKDIVSDAGVQGASNVSISFNPAYEQLTVHKIIVWRDGKPLDKLQKEAFKVIANEQELSMFVYNGNYKAYLILEDIRKGDKIECAYTISGSNPIFSGKFFTSFAFQGSDALSQIHYCVLAPASRTFNFKYFNNAEKPVVTNTNNTVLYDWDLLNVKGLEYSDNAPRWFDPAPYVQISEYANWNEITDWAYKINLPDDKLKGALGNRIAQLKAQYGTDSAGLFRAIVTIVQNEVRYMGVEMGVYSHKANNPEKVYAQRYGDCKDKSLLLVSMLRNAGLNADMALVNSVHKGKIEDDLPSPSAFNHAIVCTHFSGKNVWIDPTISYQGGAGADFYCPDYGKALVLATGNNSLTSIPEMPGGEIKYTEEYEVTEVQKPVSLTVTTLYSLNQADDIRNSFANRSESDLEKNYLNYYSKIYPHIESADTLLISDDKNANIIKTIERYTINDFFEFDSANQNYAASFYASMIKNELPVVENKKEYPIAVNYPCTIKYTIHVNAPLNWQIAHKNERISRNAYAFSYDVSAANNMLSLEYGFTYLKDHIPPGEIAQYAKDRKKITDDYLSYSFTDTPAGINVHTGPNYWAILGMIVLLAGCAYTGLRIYKTETYYSAYARYEPRAIGGWLILPVIGLIYTACRIPYFLYTSNYFSSFLWHAYDGHTENFQFKAILATEFIYNGVLVCFAVFCLVLLFKKRDILPKYIKIMYIGSLIAVTVDNICAHALFPVNEIGYKDIFRNAVAVCIWVPYFTRSWRVKETFIIPYPDLRYKIPQETNSTPDDDMTAPTGENMQDAG